ncbi:MAG: M1 family aminopeptidase, partial [Vicinamibacterales bacterium]
VATAVLASAASVGRPAVVLAQVPAAPQASTPIIAEPLDNDITIRAFLQKLEPIIQAADDDAFAGLEGPLGSREDARAFAHAEFRPGATRVVVQERDRQELSLSGIPGTVYGLTVDAFIEYGNRARIATWQFYMRPSGDSWALMRQQVVSSVDNLFRLTMDTAKQYDARNLSITAEDLQLTLAAGTVFRIDTEQGTTGLVVMGRGDMRFSPAPETEKGQVRILTGADVLESRFDAAFIRVGTAGQHFDESMLVERPVDPRDLKRAQQIFREESPKSFAVDLADLTREAWTLLPGPRDFLAEVRTRRFATLTYARSAAEPEDISVFERRRHRNVSIYASKEKLATRGRFYNEDDLAAYDVLDYDIEVTALPNRQWIDGRAKMRLKARVPGLGQLTIRLADSLVVRSLVSDKFGRLFNLRVTNQNTVLINLPSVLEEDGELTLTFIYAGRLAPQSPDRETLSMGQDDPGAAPFGAQSQFPDDVSMPRAEPSFLYSNRSFWYPQSTVSDYATARLRITVPIDYGCVASGDPTGTPELLTGSTPEDARRAHLFLASRPARYLSFIVSRFVRTDQTQVSFDGNPAVPLTDAQAASPEPLPGIRVSVEANPRQTRESRPLAGRAADIMRFYESVIGDAPYPTFTIALVENLTPGGHSPPYFAQINQPLPNSPLVWRNDPAAFENYPEFFMAHEVAHQWWGHGVGWQNYHDQWLSEGFSQYFAALYANHARGDEVFQGVLRRMRRWAITESDQGPVHLGYRVGHIKSDGRAFRAIVYNKSAMVLHMLRLMAGDEAFFKGLQRFYLSSRFRKVGSEDFRVAMEQESGLDLERFFERWIYGSTLPSVTFGYRVESGSEGLTAMLRFEQTGEIFDLPAQVTLTFADGRSRDVTVRVTDRVVEVPVRLESALKSAAISRRDVSLAEFRDAPRPK